MSAFLSLVEAADAIAAGKISSRELTEACLARIERHAKRLNCFIRLDAEAALKASEVTRPRSAARAATSTGTRSNTARSPIAAAAPRTIARAARGGQAQGRTHPAPRTTAAAASTAGPAH